MDVKLPDILEKQEFVKLPPSEKERYVREILKQIIELNPYGVTISMLKDKVPFSDKTLEKHLSVLTYINEIYTVKIGQNQLYLPNHKPLHYEVRDKISLNNREYLIYSVNNRLGEYIIVQEKKETQDKRMDIGGGITIPKEAFEEFLKFLLNWGEKHSIIQS